MDDQVGYNITFSEKHKFIWFRIAKVATRSLLDYFLKNGDCLILECSKAYVNYEKSMDYFKFAFVRNPYDRLVSCWLSKVNEANKLGMNRFLYLAVRNSFRLFVIFYLPRVNLVRGDKHLRLQSALMDVSKMDFIGHFESFETDFKHVVTTLGLSRAMPKKKNVSKNRTQHWEYYYSKSLRERVYRLYRTDFETFGYHK